VANLVELPKPIRIGNGASPRVRFRINSGGAEVFNSGSWLPADSRVLGNLIGILKEGLRV
jgi:hypothetical protein